VHDVCVLNKSGFDVPDISKLQAAPKEFPKEACVKATILINVYST